MTLFVVFIACLCAVSNQAHDSGEIVFKEQSFGEVHRQNLNYRDINGFTPLYLSVLDGNKQFVMLMIRDGADVNYKTSSGWTPLLLASHKGHKEIADVLLRNGADVKLANDANWTPLHAAAQNADSLPIVEALINRGADVNAVTHMQWTPLHFAASYGNDKIVDLLVRKGANTNSKDIGGQTPLHMATNDIIASILLENGANVNMVMNNGSSPLLIACQNGRVEVAELMIKKGADIFYKDEDGCTASHLAAKNGQSRVLSLLSRSKADLTALSNEGLAPLHVAITNNHYEVITVFFSSGADINILTTQGKTPLFLAVEYGHDVVVKELLKYSADRDIPDNTGKKPSDIATEKGYMSILSILTAISRPALKACERYLQLPFNRIIGGQEAEPKEFPWMAAVGYPVDNDISFECGGTVISEYYVLTAGHCAKEKRPPTTVQLGTIIIAGGNSSDPVNYDVEDVIRHQNYSFTTKRNDIALLRLARKIEFKEEILPACLQTDPTDDHSGGQLIVSGWGSTSATRLVRPNGLLKAKLLTMPSNECNTTLLDFNKKANHAALRNGIIDGQYCAYDPQGKNDSCQGDSGGPLQFFPNNIAKSSTIVGIVSYGVSCGTQIPSLYTKVISYLDWIEGIVWADTPDFDVLS